MAKFTKGQKVYLKGHSGTYFAVEFVEDITLPGAIVNTSQQGTLKVPMASLISEETHANLRKGRNRWSGGRLPDLYKK